MAPYEKPNVSGSLGGNDLKYRPFGRTSGWSMTLKMKPKLIKIQVSYEKHIINGGPLSLYGLKSTSIHITKSKGQSIQKNDLLITKM